MDDQNVPVANIKNTSHNSGQTVVVITGSPKLVTPFGSKPQVVKCPYCQYEVTTITEPKATMKTHLFALLLCIFSCWLCCCCPYCIECCQGKNHYCAKCDSLLGAYIN